MTVLDPDTRDIIDLSYDYSSYFDAMYDNNNIGTIDNSRITTNDNSKATMTQEQIAQSEAAANANAKLYNDYIAPLVEPIKNATGSITSGISNVASGVNSVIDKVILTGKVIIPIASIIGVLAVGYYGLNIVAKTKRNIKTIKS